MVKVAKKLLVQSLMYKENKKLQINKVVKLLLIHQKFFKDKKIIQFLVLLQLNKEIKLSFSIILYQKKIINNQYKVKVDNHISINKYVNKVIKQIH